MRGWHSRGTVGCREAVAAGRHEVQLARGRVSVGVGGGVAVAGVREAGVKEAGVVAKMRVVGVVNWVEIAVRMQVGMGEVVGAGAVGVMWVGVRVAVVAVGVVAVAVAGVGVGVGVVEVEGVGVVVVVEGVDARGSARGDRIHLGSYQDALRSCIRPGASPSARAGGLLPASKKTCPGTLARRVRRSVPDTGT